MLPGHKINGRTRAVLAKIAFALLLANLSSLTEARGQGTYSQRPSRDNIKSSSHSTQRPIMEANQYGDDNILNRAHSASALDDAGRYAEAAQSWADLVVTAEEVLGKNHPTTAWTIYRLAMSLQRSGSDEEVEALLLRALEIRDDSLGPNDPDTAKIANSLGGHYLRQGRYESAELLFKRSLRIYERILGTDYHEVAIAFNNLGFLYAEWGFHDKSENAYLRSLEISEAAPEPDRELISFVYRSIGVLYEKSRRIEKAEKAFKRSLEIRESLHGASHPSVAEISNNLAFLYTEQGRYVDAELLYRNSLHIYEEILALDHPFLATALHNLGYVHEKMGRYVEAQTFFKRGLSIREAALGPGASATAMSLNSLAALYTNTGLYSLAIPLQRRSLEILRNNLGPEHQDTVMVLENLASIYLAAGDYAQAVLLLERTNLIFERKPEYSGMRLATSLNNLAYAYMMQADYAQAEALFLKSLSHMEKLVGVEHPNRSTTLKSLAAVHLYKGQYNVAARFLRQNLDACVAFLRRELPYQPRELRSKQLHALSGSGQMTYAIADHSSEARVLALLSRLILQGLQLDIERTQSVISRASGATRSLVQQVAQLNKQISDVQLDSEQRATLRRERNNVEYQLYRNQPDLQINQVTIEGVASTLPPDGILIEFQRYESWLGDVENKEVWGAPHYIALILNPSGAAGAVPLGEATIIEDSIANALRASAEGHDDAHELLGIVADLLIKPLSSKLDGSHQLFLSLDADLHRVPFAALPYAGNSGELLGQAKKVRLLTTGRDLMRLQQPSGNGELPMVLANPNFGSSQSRSPNLVASTQAKQRSADLTGVQWDALPATALEGKQIALLLGTEAILGDAATVSLLERSPSPRILHIASHGFFVGDQDIPPQDPLRASLAGGGQVARFQGEDPLLRSGIVLAGANNPDHDPNDDGLLTALEATALQLDGTELVVLSACSTGAGDFQSGEGLYGLQRALTVAGARSTLLSLWKVDDAATAEFMVRFYRRLKAGEGRADALAGVQEEFRKGTVQSPSGEDWRRPYYWAAWQLVGDWRPIEGL
jgi:CHAT domain-containing protein/tetratricopeptide (TPR) repeat protein